MVILDHVVAIRLGEYLLSHHDGFGTSLGRRRRRRRSLQD
jgi:hypothetical protein